MMLYALAYFALVAACIALDLKTGIRRPLLVVSFPMLVLDCAINCIVLGQSWRNTMSGELWHHRYHPLWGSVRSAVDRAFFWQKDHCKKQAEKEEAHGGFWPAYAHDWRTSR